MKKIRKKAAKSFLKKCVVKAENRGNGRGGGGICWGEREKLDSMANVTQNVKILEFSKPSPNIFLLILSSQPNKNSSFFYQPFSFLYFSLLFFFSLSTLPNVPSPPLKYFTAGY